MAEVPFTDYNYPPVYQEGQNDEAGTPEHLGSDRPYEGSPTTNLVGAPAPAIPPPQIEPP